METRIDFLRWLSKKLYLITVGTYATIGLIMLLPPLIAMHFSIPMTAASFGVFFIVAFLRAAYESLVIYEAPVKSLSIYKMLILALITSSVISLASAYLKPKVGYFSIPLAIIISMFIVGRLKEVLWGATQRPGFFAELPAKLELVSLGRYGFYAFLVGITYMAYAKYDLNFYFAFAGAYFIGMIFEESYNLIKLYEQKVTAKYVIPMIIRAACCAIVSAAIVWVMMSMLGYSGQPATIASVILLKLIQPLGSRKFILRF
jgi:hypothetical protein